MDKTSNNNLNMNLHIHTTHSDGNLSPEQIIQKALKQNIEIIGFSDHFLTDKLPKKFPILLFDQYFNSINNLKKKYSFPKVLVGLEIDCGSGLKVPPDKWNFDQLNKLDFILFEYINDSRWGGRDLYEVINSISGKIKIPIGLAHTNFMKYFDLNTKEKCDELCKFLKEHNIFIELDEGESGRNSEYGTYYFEIFSPELIDSFKKYKVEFSIGTDSHSSYKLDEIKKAQRFIKYYGLNIIKLATNQN